MVTRDAGAERLQTTRRFSSQNSIEIILGRFPIYKTQKLQQFFRFRSRDVNTIVSMSDREHDRKREDDREHDRKREDDRERVDERLL